MARASQIFASIVKICRPTNCGRKTTTTLWSTENPPCLIGNSMKFILIRGFHVSSLHVAFHVSYIRGVGRLEGSHWFLFGGSFNSFFHQKKTRKLRSYCLVPNYLLWVAPVSLRGGKWFGKLQSLVYLVWFHEGVVSMYMLWSLEGWRKWTTMDSFFASERSKCWQIVVLHLSNEKTPGWLSGIGDDTTQSCGDFDKPFIIMIPVNQPV